MSHISIYKQVIKDLDTMEKLCKRHGIKHRVAASGAILIVKQYGSNEVKAKMGIHLKGWGYEIAITAEGKINYDNWGSESGSMDRLGRLVQEYNKEVILQQAYMSASNVTVSENTSGVVEIELEYEY